MLFLLAGIIFCCGGYIAINPNFMAGKAAGNFINGRTKFTAVILLASVMFLVSDIMLVLACFLLFKAGPTICVWHFTIHPFVFSAIQC